MNSKKNFCEAEQPHSQSRREWLRSSLKASAVSIGAASLGMGLSGCGSDAQATPVVSRVGDTAANLANPFRIDVHCHHIPDFYRASLASEGVLTAGGIPIPPWTPELAVNFMNLYGIQTQVVSISEPGCTHLKTPAERLALAQQINDYTAGDLINSENPLLKGRFGGFGVLPLANPQDPVDMANTIAEARRCMVELGMDGIGILSNYNGIYLGDPSLTPLMAELNRLGAMVFLHPVTPVKPDNIKLPTFLFEFTFDTTRAAINMLYMGVYRLFPNIRWLLAHAGGTLPFLAYRSSLFTVSPALAQNLNFPELEDINAFGSYSQLYYDTALSPAPSAMKSVREVTSTEHILFATDWPFSAPVFVVPGDPAPQLSESFNTEERRAVERNNALREFPALARRLSTAGRV
jgi:predicted TIM-barrel fold metal-dependent hydrolase